MTPIRVSIIIVSWNALDLLKRCLPSVVATDFDGFEIILADNASTDGSAEWVRETYPEVRIVRHPENWGFARGNNAAVPHARGNLLVLLNNDVEVPSNWLTPIVSRFDAHTDLGAAQPKLHQFTDRTRFEYSGAAGGFLDCWGYPFARGRIFDILEEDGGQYDGERNIFWASGTCLAVRQDLWHRLGGLEAAFFMHMEEIDLCWRIHRLGYRVECVPESVVYHIGGGSLPAGNPRKTFLNFRNNLLMLYRNLPRGAWWRTLIIRSMLDSLAALRSLLSGNVRDAWAIIRAYWSAHKMKNELPLNSDLPYSELPYQRSIVADHFLRGKKHFFDLPQSGFHRG
jgi:GT2 family glycosyltransferase